MSTTRLARTLAGFSGLAAVVGGAGCMDTNMLAEASFRGGSAAYDERTGELYRLYDYYPDHELYYSPFQDTYFHYDESKQAWQRSHSVPAGISLENALVEVIELPTGKPYIMHGDVLAMHPSLADLRAEAASLRDADQGALEAFASVPTDE